MPSSNTDDDSSTTRNSSTRLRHIPWKERNVSSSDQVQQWYSWENIWHWPCSRVTPPAPPAKCDNQPSYPSSANPDCDHHYQSSEHSVLSSWTLRCEWPGPWSARVDPKIWIMLSFLTLNIISLLKLVIYCSQLILNRDNQCCCSYVWCFKYAKSFALTLCIECCDWT